MLFTSSICAEGNNWLAMFPFFKTTHILKLAQNIAGLVKIWKEITHLKKLIFATQGVNQTRSSEEGASRQV